MRCIEYGTQHPKTVVLLHGGGLSWWNYREAAKYLSRDYHVVLPVLNGHGDSDTPFTTIEENAAQIIAYIEAHFGGRVTALGGLSLGGQIAVEMLSQRPDICGCALIESALVKPMRLTHALIGPAFGMCYGLIKYRWFAKMQAAYLGIPRDLFEDYYRDTCNITKADMIAFLQSNSAYTLKPGLAKTTAKVQILVGSREQPLMGASARVLNEVIPNSTMEILPGLRHGDLSLNHPQRYAKILGECIREAEEKGFLRAGFVY